MKTKEETNCSGHNKEAPKRRIFQDIDLTAVIERAEQEGYITKLFHQGNNHLPYLALRNSQTGTSGMITSEKRGEGIIEYVLYYHQ